MLLSSSPYVILNKLAKPRLTALEACHRLALREGQKENKKGNANVVKKLPKIHITIFALVFITLMIALPMTLRSVAALGPTGTSYSKDTYVNTGGASFPRFNDCEHTHLNYPDNMMVGLGVYTYYDTNVGYPAYNYGNWWFSTQAGWSSSTTDNSPVHSMPPMGCIFDLDFTILAERGQMVTIIMGSGVLSDIIARSSATSFIGILVTALQPQA